MREIIQLQVGNCGNKIGMNFWDLVFKEHGLTPSGDFKGQSRLQQERLAVYFNETHTTKYTPRAILVDLDAEVLDQVQSTAISQSMDRDNFIGGKSQTGNIYSKGFYSEGSFIIDEVLEAVQKQSEMCDSLHGFQLCHSISGGTGSGLTSLALSHMKERFPDTIFQTFTVFPSEDFSENILETYNAVLSLHHLIEKTEITHILDNKALHRIATEKKQVPSPTYEDMNSLISYAMSGTTCGFRFPGQLNSNLRKLATNLVPFPRLHFFMTSLAPLRSKFSCSLNKATVPEIVHEMFDKNSLMCSADPSDKMYLTGSGIFRGQLSTYEIEQQLFKIRNRNSANFVS